MSDNNSKVGLIGLIAIVFGSMIGGGIFNIPQNMAAASSLGPVIIAWIITGVGMLFLAYTFKNLANARPDLTSGIYAYAREGFGKYVGFNAAWGYWIAAALGNVAFAVMLNDAVGYFWPVLLKHHWQTIVFGVVLIWIMNFIVLKGVEGASALNTISTIAKMLAIALIIVIMIIFFNLDNFTFDFWGKGLNLGSLGEQIKSPMLVTLWSFIGIEGAVVISSRAKKSSDVGKATVIGLLLAILLYVAISVLAFGMMHQPELAKLQDPSAGYLLKSAVGNWGIDLVNISVIISVGGAWIAWTILLAEVPFQAAKDGILPKIFSRSNKKGSPSAALYISSLTMSLFMFLVVFASDVYMAAIAITGIMILPPYILSTGYLWKASYDRNIFSSSIRGKAMMIGIMATVYCAWLIYAAGLNYILLSTIFYALGIPFYIKASRETKTGKKVFNKGELILAVVFVLVALLTIYLLYSGNIKY
jgi:arginine:ornithine antiporter/lysine permease